ncbi:MAG: hypothetical protein J1F35_00210 [Erysipelotrichales bacterium]|nr:hypothetical protein [Erysipelotrichales bacterium]
MKVLKKYCLIIMIMVCLVLTACAKASKEQNVAGTLEEIMTKVYASVPEEERPMALTNIEVTDENIEGFLGTSDIEYDSILASESMVGSIAHSVVLIRTKENADVNAIKAKIKENINPRKWVCVGVEPEDVIIENKGNLIIIIVIEDENIRNNINKEFKGL